MLRPGERPPTHHPDGAKWLTILNETGFLGRYLPDWGRIVLFSVGILPAIDRLR